MSWLPALSGLIGAAGLWSLYGLLPAAVLAGLAGLAVSLVIFYAALGAGSRLLRPFREQAPAEGALLGASLGLGLLALAVLAVGSAGQLKGPIWAPVLVGLFLVWGWRDARSAISDLGRELARNWAVLAPSGLMLAAVFWAAWMPPHQYDSLVYHLVLPQSYLRSGTVRPVPGLLFSHFTQNGEMLYALAMKLGSDLAAQSLNAVATALGAGLVWTLARRRASPAASAFAVFLYASHPAVLLIGSTAYTEPWVGLWLLSAFACFERWLEADPGGVSGLSRMAAAGFFCGLAIGAKYYAGLAPAILFLYAAWRLRRKGPWRPLAVLSLSTLLPFVPWLAKDLVYVGNPVFPFLYRWFPAYGVDWGTQPARYFAVFTEYGHPRGFLYDLLNFPIQLFVDPLRFGGGMDVLGDLGWPILFLGLPLALARLRGDKLRTFRAAYLMSHLALWFCSRVVLRFLIPIAGLLAVVSADGYDWLWGRTGRLGRIVLACGLGALIAARLQSFAYVHGVFETSSVLLGLESPEQYLSRRLAYYPCAERADRTAGPGDKVIVIGEQRSYYIRRDSLATSPYQRNLYQVQADRSIDGREFAQRLRAEGFGYLIWVPGEARRLAPYGVDEGLEGPAWRDFLAARRPEFQSTGCSLYAL